MRHDSIGRIILLTLGAIFTALLPCRGQDDAELPSNATVRPSQTIPIMYITTADGKPITAKEEYKRATFYIANPAGKVSPGATAEPLGMSIRGRGHSSWGEDKKPYKLKPDEKLSLMGMPENKYWTLLKFWPPTMAGTKLGQLMRMVWAPSAKPVEVVLSGDYVDLYLLTKTIRIGKNQVNIYEQPNNSEDVATIPGGWLVEADNYKGQNQIDFRESDHWIINITYRSPKVLSTAQKNWLTAGFKGLNGDIYAPNKTISHWKDHVDIDTTARFFIIQEVTDSPDGFHGSFHLHKDQDGGSKRVAGPTWDLTCMNREKTDYTFRMKTSYVFALHWIGGLLKDRDFSSVVCKVWREEHPVFSGEWMRYLESCFAPYEKAYERGRQHWTKGNFKPLHSIAEKLTAALRRNVDWFNEHLPTTPNVIALVVSTTDRRIVYTMSGEVVRIADDYSEAVRGLPQGVYIVGNSRVIIPQKPDIVRCVKARRVARGRDARIVSSGSTSVVSKMAETML